MASVERDPNVGTFRSVGLPVVDFDTFHLRELPRRLRDGANQRVAWDVAQAAPICFRLPSGSAFSYVPLPGRVEIVPGRVEDAVGLRTAAGDATVHLGCGVHAGPRPTGPNRRRTIYVRFDNPRVFELTEAFETYDQVIPGYGSGALPSVEEMKARAYA